MQAPACEKLRKMENELANLADKRDFRVSEPGEDCFRKFVTLQSNEANRGFRRWPRMFLEDFTFISYPRRSALSAVNHFRRLNSYENFRLAFENLP